MSETYHGKHRLEDTDLGGADEDWAKKLQEMNEESHKDNSKNN